MASRTDETAELDDDPAERVVLAWRRGAGAVLLFPHDARGQCLTVLNELSETDGPMELTDLAVAVLDADFDVDRMDWADHAVAMGRELTEFEAVASGPGRSAGGTVALTPLGRLLAEAMFGSISPPAAMANHPGSRTSKLACVDRKQLRLATLPNATCYRDANGWGTSGAVARLRSVSVDQQIVGFDQLDGADLVIDRIYQGGRAGNTGDDPLGKLLPVGNQGGFRVSGSPKKDSVKVAVLYTSGAEPDWPDVLDPYTGVFTYFGDNRSPGRLLEDTPRSGNLLLSGAFARAHGEPADRAKVAPFLLFDKPGGGRDVRFRGLLAPGSGRLSGEEDLVAVWRTTRGERFQNYRAHFTVLNVPVIPRAWIKQLLDGETLGSESPRAWQAWVESRTYAALVAPPTAIIRSREQQEPLQQDRPLLALVHEHFARNPYGFEQFAADLWAASERNVDKIDVTRPWRDGGRDAIGDYLIGPPSDPVAVEFALEAKCYAPGNSVGVRETSRLISRLRHRQFGVLVTTSHVDAQAYREIRDDGHPVVILVGRDVVEILKRSGLDTAEALRKHLLENYPQREAAI